MLNNSTEIQLNRKGNRRGMHGNPNSRKNLEKGRLGNNHAKKELSITRIQREMMGQSCSYAKDPTWTWAYAIAEAEMRAALGEQKARDSIKDRLEGKVDQGTGIHGEIIIKVKYDDNDRIHGAPAATSQ